MGPMSCLACTVGTNWLIYSVAAGESLSAAGLLLAGIVPAILLGGAMLTCCCVAARWRGYSLNPKDLFLQGVARQIPRIFLAVLLPMLVMGGLVSGVLTGPQAAGIVIAHSLWLGLCIMQEIRGQGLSGALIYAGLFVLVPIVLPLAAVYGFVHFPGVFAWLPELLGY